MQWCARVANFFSGSFSGAGMLRVASVPDE